MRQISVPQMKFSKWFAWDDRHTIPQSEYPGVYRLSITGKKPAELDWADVSYIGMTNSLQGLRGRWQQFFNSIQGKSGHSGGKTVFQDLGDYKSWREKLYVSAMPVECNVASPSEDDLIRMGWVAYLEYEAFAEFCRHCPARGKPKYNTR